MEANDHYYVKYFTPSAKTGALHENERLIADRFGCGRISYILTRERALLTWLLLASWAS
jgi:hypothetical protein